MRYRADFMQVDGIHGQVISLTNGQSNPWIVVNIDEAWSTGFRGVGHYVDPCNAR